MRHISLIILLLVTLCFNFSAKAQTPLSIDDLKEKLSKEAITENLLKERKDIVLSDSAINNINKKRLPRLLYESIVEQQNEQTENTVIHDERLEQYKNLEMLKGKKIGSIRVLPLPVWGIDFSDTTQVEKSQLGDFLNNLPSHTREQTVKRNVFIELGEELDPERLLENERVLRSLPFIRDAQILAQPSLRDTNEVNLVVMTKDVLAYGITGSYSSLNKWTGTVYNRNMFGQGHELRGSWIHNASEEIHDGYNFQYKIHNFTGTYSNFGIGYTRNYQQEGMNATLDRPFLRTDTKWGGSAKFYRYWNSNSIYGSPYDLDGFKVNYATFDAWTGYAFELPSNKGLGENQLVISARYRQYDFYDRPDPGEDGNQIYANSNMILGSVSLANRYYIRDNLIQDFGNTEDMPKGFFHELVVGYDNNEFINRWYAHAFLSSGDLVKYRSSYLYLSGGIGSFFNLHKMQQGELRLQLNYISKQLKTFNRSMRYFIDLKYLNGVNRFEQEYITLNNDYGLRGFSSNEVRGQKKIALRSDVLLFHKRKVLGFNTASFAMLDVGIIGAKNKFLLGQDYYAGIGGGIRMRNDNLIFDTIQIRLIWYPKYPSDQSPFDFQFKEGNPTLPYDFQPRMPETLEYR